MLIGKGLLAGAAIAGSLGLSAGGAATVQAAHFNKQEFAQAIATQFSLNATDVEATLRDLRGTLPKPGSDTANGQTREQALADALATDYNLDTDAVLSFLADFHATQEQEHEARWAEMLQKAVTDGKLTQEQADAIQAKHKEMLDFRASLEGLTPDERHEAVKTQAEDIKAWAEANDLNLGGHLGGRMAHDMHRFRGHYKQNQAE
jgi:hypothetical protein